MSSTSSRRRLNIDNINPHVKTAKYAVRGELAVRAEEYRRRLAEQSTSKSQNGVLPFDKVISANIGNPQQLDQKPITFFRQVLSLMQYPPLLEKEDVLLNQLGYKPDVLERARRLLKECHSVGAYSHSQGVPVIRNSIAKFIERKCLIRSRLNDSVADLYQAEMDILLIQTQSSLVRAPLRVSVR